MSHSVCLDRLLKLRLVVARHGEMDAAGWWNTQGVLGPRGRMVLQRGLASTHHFAQARIVFEVARSRCRELFHPPGCMTLWDLPAELESQFQEHWQVWLDDNASWAPIFDAIESQQGEDLLTALERLNLVSGPEIETVNKLRRSAEGRAVPIAGTFQPDDEIVTLLAAGFSRGEKGKPAIPYAKLDS